MYLDFATIFVKAGNGGDGIVSFYRDKFTSRGGPDGGSGGKGGDIVILADSNVRTLLDFKFQKHFRAENGENGGNKNKTGKSGENLIIRVPCGTVVKDKKTGKIIADMFNDGSELILLQGGDGGRGNATFATSTRKAPNFSQQGLKTKEREIILELKTVADVGLVGFPNVGKSTILSVTTKAKPKIANYHFTTLSPNLGVVQYLHDSFVMADIPGLIEGASDGAGLGHNFLKHIERVRLIVHVIDISGHEGRDPFDDYNKIRKELEMFSKVLTEKEEIICLNKIDLLQDANKAIKEFEKKINKKVYPVSAITGAGTKELVDKIYTELKKLPPIQPLEFEKFEYEQEDIDAYEIIKLDDGSFEIKGGYINNLARGIVLSDYHSLAYFQKQLEQKGIIDDLRKRGAKNGTTVRILDFEFELVD